MVLRAREMTAMDSRFLSGITAFVLGLVGTLFFMQLLAAANRTNFDAPQIEQRPTIH